MASTYVNDLRLNEMGTGDESGNWGVVTNTNLELIGEAFSYGTEGITTNADTHSTTIADGATDPGRSMYVKYTGTLDSTCTVSLLPNTVSKLWIIENATSGGHKLSIKQGSGAEIVIRNGDVKAVYSDGAGSGAAMFDALIDLNVGTKLSINNAGTGDGSEATLLMSTAESDIAANDIIGKIQFQAPDEGTGTDANLVAAEIAAVSEGDFSSSSNATKLSFKTGASEAAAEKMTLSSSGVLEVTGHISTSSTVNPAGDTSAGDNAAIGYTSAEGLILTGQGSTGDVTVKNDADAVVMQIPTGTTGVDFKGNIFTTTAGTSNFVAGVNAGNTIESGGNYNVCVGDEAGTAVTTGDANIYIGFQAGDAATTGGDNIAIGYDALTTMSTAASNTVVGAYAGDAINTGHQNTLIGHQAGTDLTTGAQNTFLGKNAGDDVTDGAENTLVGFNAAAHSTALTTGDFNVHLGIYTSASSADAQTETVIGYNGQGKGNTTGFIINNGGVYQGNNSADWSTTSDRRIKKNIEDNEQGLDIINNIRVRNFEYRTEDEITEVPTSAAIETEGVQLGVIAQEIEEVLPEVVNEESTGVKSVNSGNLTWYLVNAVKELSAQVEELKQWKSEHDCCSG
jgi:hypothetical protein